MKLTFVLRSPILDLMVLSKYQQEISEIRERIAEKRKIEIEDFIKNLDERLNIEEQIIIEAFDKYWTLKNSVPPSANEKSPFSENDSQNHDSDLTNNGNLNGESKELSTRNDKIRNIVRQYEKGVKITSHKVFESFEKQYPDLAPDLADKKTLISKILRQLEERGELERIQKGSGATQTIYRKL